VVSEPGEEEEDEELPEAMSGLVGEESGVGSGIWPWAKGMKLC